MTQEKIGLLSPRSTRLLALVGSIVMTAQATAEDLRPFFANYCTQCHSAEKQKGDLNMEPLLGTGQPRIEDAKVWDKILHAIKSREMPPDGKKQPMEDERLHLAEVLGGALDQFHQSGPRNPGRVAPRRLNRAEYENTIRDLLGVTFQASEEFPRDEVGYGFDNIGDVLSLTPLLMEKYLDAAEKITAQAILAKIPVWPPEQRVEDNALIVRGDDEEAVVPYNDRYLGFYREGRATAEITTAQAGNYELRLRAYQEAAGPEAAAFEVEVDGALLRRFDIQATIKEPQIYAATLPLEKGAHRVSIRYANNYVDGNNPDPKLRGDRNVYLDYVEIVGPLDTPAPALPGTHTRIIPRQPAPGQEEAVAREVFSNFAARAYRRPAEDAEVERLVSLAKDTLREKATFEEAITTGVQAVLVSPHFLFRWELDPAKDDDGVRAVGDYELASRLSYFLWSSMPDAELFAAAATGQLSQHEALLAQAKRMLADAKSSALVANFAGQWLQIRNMDTVQPDPETFPQFGKELRAAMKRETEMFFQAIAKEDRSVLDLLDADYTYLNERLAKHYGIDNIKGQEFRRVALDPTNRRGGVLTQASVLTLTSNPTRTSPVNRGKWVLEQLLGTPPPPPPPNVTPLAEGKKASETASLRERMEIHRSNPDCAGCHAKMDPIGFALENYDAIGRWRDLDGTFPIDPSGELAGGVKISGADGLKTVLKGREDFLRCFSEKMLTYALGRGTEFYDKATITELVNALRADHHRFSALINAIVLSPPFRQRNIES